MLLKLVQTIVITAEELSKPAWDASVLVGADPLFEDGTPDEGEYFDFRLQYDSQAKNAGAVSLSYGSPSFDGIVRGVSWDIGAFEYISSETDVKVPDTPSGLMVN